MYRFYLFVALAGLLSSGCFWSKKSTHTAPAPKRRPSSAAAKKTGTTRPRANAASTPAPSARSGGSLGEILTPGSRDQLQQSLDRSLANARGALVTASQRKLSSEEAEKVRLARTFMAQAERARQSDIAVAAQMARRAELIAQSLVE